MSVYRSTYHYGNLRAVLADAALDLARRGGPAAVTVRGVARKVGVTPTAAYRHFTEVEELLTVTKVMALTLLAEGVDDAIGNIAGIGVAAGDSNCENRFENAIVAAVACVRAVAEAYVSFAQAFPGLFAMACHGSAEGIRILITERLGPFLEVLSVRRPGMGFALWSAVHALAVLAAGGAATAGSGSAARDVSQDEVLDTVLAWIAGDVLIKSR